MRTGDALAPGQIRNRAGHAQGAVGGAGRPGQALGRFVQQGVRGGLQLQHGF